MKYLRRFIGVFILVTDNRDANTGSLKLSFGGIIGNSMFGVVKDQSLQMASGDCTNDGLFFYFHLATDAVEK